MIPGKQQGNGGKTPARWEIIDRREEASFRVFPVGRKRCRHPIRGREDDFFVLESSDWVNVAVVTPDGQMVLVEQYRFGSETLSLEVPGGLMDRGENPIFGPTQKRERAWALSITTQPNPARIAHIRAWATTRRRRRLCSYLLRSTVRNPLSDRKLTN